MSGGARAADVNIAADVGTGVNLDTEVGSTVEINPGITVTNAPFSRAINASTSAWALTNRGSVTSSFANTISLSVDGSSVTNYSSIVAGSSNAVWMTGGGNVDNKAGASISADQTGVRIGTAPTRMLPGFGPGTVTNAGTITQTGTVGDLVSLFFGGTVTNLEGGTISANSSSSAVSVGQGASRTVTNSGTITNTGTGYAAGVFVQGGPSTVTNNEGGLIRGTYNGVFASPSSGLTFTNHGTIRSTGAATLEKPDPRAVDAAGGGTFLNTGTIESAWSDGLYLGQGGTVTNSGTITGATRAINFSGNYARTLSLDTGSVLNGLVQGGTGVDDLVLLGSGTESAAKFLAFEKLKMQGADWTLSGIGTFATSVSVETGLLSVNGTLTSPTVTIDPLARLGGSGTIVGAVTNKGTIAAGNSIGTLSVQGSVVFETGSTLEVEVNPSGQEDLVAVTGTATINGGTVSVLAASGTYAPSTPYTIVSTTAGLEGIFSGVTSNLAFLAPSLTYDAKNAYLTLVNNGIDFDAIGGTPNERAAGRGVQGLGTGDPIYDAVLVLDIPGARYAFDQLSGEIHASVAGLLLDDSRHVREAALDRLRDGFGDGADRLGMWVQGYGAYTDLDGDGNAAQLDYDSAGVFAGLDGELGEAWQAGVLVGYSRATFDVDERNSSGSADSFHLAAYGGGEWGGFGLRGGAAYAWHDIETARAIAFQGYSDSADADYDGHTAQVFGEAGYAFQAGPMTFEPTAALAYVDVGTDGFTEDGGDAALASEGTSADATFSTLGFRARAPFDIGGLKAQASGFLGWRHAFGAAVPTIDLAFAGGTPFTVAGVPIAEDAAVVDLGLDFQTGAASRLGLTYSGQFGDGATSQAFKADLHVSF